MSLRHPSPLTRLRVAARTDAGLSRRHNEDSFVVADLSQPLAAQGWILPPRPPEVPGQEGRGFTPERTPAPVSVALESTVGVALAVIDGMGGICSGNVAARIAADTFAAAFTVAPSGHPGGRPSAPSDTGEDACRQRVVAAMKGASRAVLEAATTGPKWYVGMGAAALLAVVSGDRLHLAGAGDCRAYLLRAGRLVQVTRDDSLLNDYRAQLGPDADLSEIPSMVITKALGLTETVDLQPSTFELRAGDVILLSTDGLHDQLDDLAIERTLLDLPDPAEASLALVNLANRHGGADNVAVVVARPEGDALRPPGPGDALESRNVP